MILCEINDTLCPETFDQFAYIECVSIVYLDGLLMGQSVDDIGELGIGDDWCLWGGGGGGNYQ
jgi:hypothetical protein